MAITHADLEQLTSAQTSFSHLLTRVDRYDLAFPIGAIERVHAAPFVFPVPAAANVLGAVKVHGEAIIVVDIRRSLRVAPKPVAHEDRLLLLRTGGRAMGVIVDEVLSFIELPTADMVGLDPLFGDTPVNRQIIAGVVGAPNLIAVVNVDGLSVPQYWDDVAVAAAAGDQTPSALEATIDPNHPLAERTAALAAPLEAIADKGFDVAAFELGGQRYAVPLAGVHAFFRDLPHSPLPHHGPVGASLINFRGEALALYDVKSLLGLAAGPLPGHVDGMVLAAAGCKFAIAVDDLAGLDRLGDAASGTKLGDYCLSIHVKEQAATQLLDVAAVAAAPQLRLTSEGLA